MRRSPGTDGPLPGPFCSRKRELRDLRLCLLRAADLAADIGGATATSDGRRWAAAALAAAITATFGRNGYQRAPDAGSGADAASRSSGRHSQSWA